LYIIITKGINPKIPVLSMTGILGFIPFVIIIYKSVKRVWSKKKTNIEASLYLGLIVFLSIHMLVEGYIFAGGSVLCFIAWLIISCCYEIKIEK
jgi:O-antigen ligase